MNVTNIIKAANKKFKKEESIICYGSSFLFKFIKLKFRQ